MFKKPQEDGAEPRIKDFHMDAEHRKYLFSEEYCTGVPGAVPEMTVKEYALLQEQQKLLLFQQQQQKQLEHQRKSRSKTPPSVFAKKDGTIFDMDVTISCRWYCLLKLIGYDQTILTCRLMCLQRIWNR